MIYTLFDKFNSVREINRNYNKKKALIITFIIFILGIILGIASKSIDNLELNNSIWWHNIVAHLDLGNILSSMGIWLLFALIISVYSKTPFRAALNVFVFFIGMNVSYHLWTVIFSGFNPGNYMKIWYTLTILSPFLAFICWYAKGNHVISIVISSLILSVMMPICFSMGHWYIYYKSLIDTIIYLMTIFVLYKNIKCSLVSVICSFFLSFITCVYIIF